MNGDVKFIPQHPPLSDPQMPPPYRFENVGMRIFVIEAKTVLLQKVCKHFFNDIAVRDSLDFRINPIADLFGNSVVYLQILSYPKIYSAAQGYENLGFITQNEVLVGIPVVYENLYQLPLAVGMFVPFLFVDNDWSIISGREVLGYPKVNGKIALDTNPSNIIGTKAQARAVKSFGTDVLAKYEDVLAITQADREYRMRRPFGGRIIDPTSATPIDEYWPFGPVDELFGEGSDNPVAPNVYDLLIGAAGTDMTNFTLKQFRDAVNPELACYQSILESTMKVDGFSGGGIYKDAKITLTRHDSLEIAARLGVEAPGGVLDPILGFWYEANLKLDDIETLHERCGSESAVEDPGPQKGEKPAVSGDSCQNIMGDICESNLKAYRKLANVWIDTIDGCLNGKD